MSEDLVDRALREERPIAPSPQFADRVMRRIRLEADRRNAIAFPWRRFAPGLAASALLVALAVAAAALRGEPFPEGIEPAPGRLAAGAAWLSMALSGTYALVWGARRLAAPGR